MAVTTSYVDQPQPIQIQGSPQGLTIRVVKWAADAAYPTGGYPVTPAFLGLQGPPWGMIEIGRVTGTENVIWRYLQSPQNTLQAGYVTSSGLQGIFTEYGASAAGVNNNTPTFLVFAGGI